jgi:RNA polymerase sigma factor (sigma-70 family)
MTQPNRLERQDADLILACRRGDGDAWAALVARYQKLIYTIPRRAGLDDDQCADIFQQTFQTLFEHIDRLDEPERVRAWLVTTARRATDRTKARAARWHPLPETGSADDEAAPTAELPDPTPLPQETILTLEEQHTVRTTVALLDERCRRLLTRLFYDEERLAYREIAAELGIPEGSIGPTRNRCLQKLRDLLQEVGFLCIFLPIACSV